MKSDSLSSSSFSEDDDDSVRDTTYIPPYIVSKSNSHCELNSTSDSSEANTTGVETPMILTSPLKKGVKRKRNESNWVRNVNKKLRNSGKEYKMRSTCQKVRKERKIEPPCTEKCKRKCFEKFTEEERMVIFRSYWDLAMYEKQRIFIQNSMELIRSKYRFVREGGTRKKRENNNGFYYHLNGQKVRVCKLFFKNTLNINDRPIRTVQEKRNKVANVLLMEDCRGKQRKIDEIEEYYNQHIVEKELSRKEKKYDKEEGYANVVVYDLQAVMQIPKGDVSVFYYKSKLYVFNFTICDLKSNECECFVWDESNGYRGINELGSCVLRFLNKRAVSSDEDFIFYSDNCAGQQKNKFMVALYLYAVSHLNVKSITHKYLIKGHTQNEGDSAHSLIERQVKRQLKGGPMYTPESRAIVILIQFIFLFKMNIIFYVNLCFFIFVPEVIC